ncbi:6-pyruvoyl trahydropterin synthase family protein [Algoriphagus persicinus]|uniref:6-pyruvoyl trahydropterin synthase family protein n=1 Tax=Algoriphagus persicinus TaxID=3108754 RepID=UPI002B3F88C3|nr:6-carboxytetrahydropterin synthase [Algoriphagus sp. E1-3-M2]MEB2785336.1 6-carboxytetrahydropterin synthase [Algoriphagus sp. E1-3-M2]
MISLTKKIEFEAAHRLSNYQGSCSGIHGHTYKLAATVRGLIDPDTDMILDFKTLKSILQLSVLDPLDHALILKENPENRRIFSAYTGKITWMESEPTSERMIEWMSIKIKALLPSTIELIELQLYETSGSFTTWKNNKG